MKYFNLSRSPIALFLVVSFGAAVASGDDKSTFECRWTEEPITLDGAADEPAWQRAELIDNFYLPWLRENRRPPKTKTAARLLWDRQYLYFFADLEDTDLYADVTEHDGQTWNNDVFELFFKPSEDRAGYYEMQVNAAGTMMDMFLPRRGAGGFGRFAKDGDFHLEAKVRLRGTLNHWQDKDQGWSVEGRLPWRDFVRTGGRPTVGEAWKFALCRYDYSVDFEGPDLSTNAPLNSKPYSDFHHHEDYATLRFVGPPQQSAVRPYGIQRRVALTTSRVVGSPDPPPPYVAQRAFPNLKLSWPIFMINEPGSRRLIFIDQNRSYGPSRICRTTDDPANGEYDVLLQLKDTAYSIAFHPNFKQNGYMYVGGNEAPASGGPKRSYIKRYTIERKPPYRFDPDSAKLIIDWEADGHNGAAVAFGLDGMLFVTSGDGTSDSDTNLKGQGLDHLLAKVLRIDVDHPDAGRAYSVPSDNPFVGVKGARPETWAYGFRNPWRATVDPVTGNLWVGNNGQDLWEQAYLVERGANYGWSVYEGSHPFYLNRKPGPTPHVNPTLEHPHSQFRSLTGGVVYYGEKLPELRGAYIYGDHSTGKIWGAKVDGKKVVWHKELADTPFNITAFAIDADGELLIADHHGNDEGGFYHLGPRRADTQRHEFPRKLSESGLFRSVAGYEVEPALIPYSVNSPLWSDGAYKERHIALPGADSKIEFTTSGSWDFPDETVLVKSFALETVEGDPNSRRWIETRFLTKQQGEWVGYSYAWNNEQTDATLVPAEGADSDFYIRTPSGPRKQPWRFPSRTECMVCHSRAAKFVLGPSTAQMNKDHDYDGVVDNQLRVLEHLGVFGVNWMAEAHAAIREELKAAGLDASAQNKRFGEITATRDQRPAPLSSLLFQHPERYAKLADPYDETQPIAARARSYLQSNCAQCHVAAGGGNAQIDLAYSTTLDNMKAIDVAPLHHKYNLPNPRIIAPGHPERSVLLHRIAMRGPGQMPQLATAFVDERAVDVVRRWIAELPPTARHSEP